MLRCTDTPREDVSHYRVSDTRPIRIRRRYARETFLSRIHFLFRIPTSNTAANTSSICIAPGCFVSSRHANRRIEPSSRLPRADAATQERGGTRTIGAAPPNLCVERRPSKQANALLNFCRSLEGPCLKLPGKGSTFQVHEVEDMGRAPWCWKACITGFGDEEISNQIKAKPL